MATALARAEAAIDRSERALEKAQARIEKLDSRMFWRQVLGPLAFVATIAFGGGR